MVPHEVGMAHGQWTEVEARGVLEAWRKSGLTLHAFAQARSLVPQRLSWWKKKLDGTGTRKRPVVLVGGG